MFKKSLMTLITNLKLKHLQLHSKVFQACLAASLLPCRHWTCKMSVMKKPSTAMRLAVIQLFFFKFFISVILSRIKIITSKDKV